MVFPAHSVVRTGYTTPTLLFSDTLLVAEPLIVYIHLTVSWVLCNLYVLQLPGDT